ncbi:tRNA pseudouridine(38-40) synthase TruA [Aeoliella sp. SH292]|uniref:tRNA pseudouridine(38-40) synthase TruA n=1 Tax=Aeoliella sp. SH292 TaxID=3454464 RepID=UPI003F99F49E
MSEPPVNSVRWLKLTVAYDGTAYAGWQIQPSNPTVQRTLMDAWQAITGEEVTLTASGRTDAGVHALGQVVGLATASELACERLRQGLNAKLPEDIVVTEVTSAPPGFHATHDALLKLYRYRIHNSRVRPLLDRRYRWHLPQELNVAAMREAGAILVGRHDFACFETTGSERSSTVRTLTKVEVGQGGTAGELIDIDVEGDGFLYNMVRGIVGTLYEVGRGAREPSWVAEVLAGRDRKKAGPNAPAHGLVLMRVDYGD